MLIVFAVLAAAAVIVAIFMFTNKNLEGENESKKYVRSGTFFIILAVVFGIVAAANINMHTHDFSAATCTEPETCKTCGETRGSASGHTCEIGKCSNCGENINYDVYTKLCDDNNSIKEFMDNALKNYDLGSNDDSDDKYDYYQDMFDDFEKTEEFLLSMTETCGNYGELSELKELLNAAYENSLGTTVVYPNNADSLLEDAEAFIDAYNDFEQEFSNVYKLFE